MSQDIHGFFNTEQQFAIEFVRSFLLLGTFSAGIPTEFFFVAAAIHFIGLGRHCYPIRKYERRIFIWNNYGQRVLKEYHNDDEIKMRRFSLLVKFHLTSLSVHIRFDSKYMFNIKNLVALFFASTIFGCYNIFNHRVTFSGWTVKISYNFFLFKFYFVSWVVQQTLVIGGTYVKSYSFVF